MPKPNHYLSRTSYAEDPGNGTGQFDRFNYIVEHPILHNKYIHLRIRESFNDMRVLVQSHGAFGSLRSVTL